jgi:hypothetical protein
MPAIYVERSEDLHGISDAYRHCRILGRPYVVALGRDVLKGIA